MRAIIFVVLVAFAYADVELGHRMDEVDLDEFQTRLFESSINKSVECIKKLLKEGDQSIDLPPLDPFVLENMAIDLDQYGWDHFKGQLELSSFKAEDHFSWHIFELKVSPTIIPIGVKATVGIEWANAHFAGGYKLNADILDHSVVGTGQVSGSADNFKVKIVLQGALSRVSIRSLKITPSLEDIQFHIGELIIDGNDVSGIINSKVDNVLQLIKNNMDVIGEKLAEAIMNILKKNIYGITRDNQMDSIIGAIMDCIEL